MRRQYGFCAKGGEEKALNTHFVCDYHTGMPGLYTHCAVCGTALTQPEPNEDGEGRNYVCFNDLVNRSDVELVTP